MNLDVLGLIAILLLTLALGEPLYVIMGSVALYCLVIFGGQGLDVLATAMIGETRGLADNPVLLAIPFFVLAGGLMTEGTIAQRLIQVARSVFGWMPGGMAVAAVSACVFFAAISGSSPVTVIAIGTIMYPALVKEGYPDRFANGLVTSAGSLGILIPPSIPMIVYAIVDPTRFADPPPPLQALRGRPCAAPRLLVPHAARPDPGRHLLGRLQPHPGRRRVGRLRLRRRALDPPQRQARRPPAHPRRLLGPDGHAVRHHGPGPGLQPLP